MTERNEAPLGTAFTVPIEAREGVTTGISAADRSHTIQVAINPQARPATSTHRALSSRCALEAGGVLRRIGQTEAAVDLARLAGLTPAGVVCEIMNEDGTMARVPDPGALLGARPTPHDHRRPAGRVPAPARAARGAPGRHTAADRRTAVQTRGLPRDAHRPKLCVALVLGASPARLRTCSSVSTPSA